MERTISTEERIRRAEEIYARRKNANAGTSIPYARMNVTEKRRITPIKKMIIQIIICLIIYTSFYFIKNGDYIFSNQVIKEIESILEYDISFENLSSNLLNYINKMNNINPNIPEENKQNTNETENKKEDIVEGITEENNTQIDTLGATDVNYEQEVSSISQEEIDANYIKENCSLIKPLQGTITSRFGNRNPTVASVPKYHTGIDIAANVGTKIIASMEGEVILVSSKGDYGNHVKIKNGEVTTMYAHCSKIYINEGDKIKQGQEIAEVGATGNVTGPHLHFEIKRNNNLVDPDYILEF